MKTKYLLPVSVLSLSFLCGCNGNTRAIQDCLNRANVVLESFKNEISTCYDAVTKLEEKNVTFETLSGGDEYVYDSKAKQMIVMNGDRIIMHSTGYNKTDNTLDYFKFVTSYNPNSLYSQYLLKEADVSSDLFITTGLDVGKHKDVKNVTYSNLSGKAKEVIIRTFSDRFTINAPNDIIHHYEDATNILVTAVNELYENAACAYLRAKQGNINFESDAVDIFEIEKVYGISLVTPKITNPGKASVYGTLNCENFGQTKELTYTEVDSYEGTNGLKAQQTSGADFIRMTADIEFDTGRPESNEANKGPLSFTRNACIDLNGKRLSFSKGGYGVTSSQLNEAIRVAATTESDRSLYLLDSQNVENPDSGIILNDCGIVVTSKYEQGKESHTGNLVINGGKITQTVTGDTYGTYMVGAAVTILGDNLQTGTETEKINYLNMYGGSIQVNNKSTDNEIVGCIAEAGKGAVVNISYGELTSDNYCVYCGDSTGKTYKYEGTVLNIYGGKLKSSNNTCINFPMKTTVNIDGGSLTGPSCININKGSLSIDSANLYASNKYDETLASGYDGSAICIPKISSLDVEISNSTIESRYAYILSAYGTGSEEDAVNLTFNDSTYNYHLGDGVLYKDSEHVKVLAKNGTWNKIYS